MSADFVLAGVDLTVFVESWLSEVDAQSDSGLLHLAVSTPDESSRYLYGIAGLMSFIAPRVWGEAGSQEELLLYAALACYKHHLGLRPGQSWPGPRMHVRRAFAYVQAIGEGTAANVLRQEVARHATVDEAREHLDKIMWKDKSVAERAAHEQEMAQGDRRDLRAATALDGTEGDPWEAMPSI